MYRGHNWVDRKSKRIDNLLELISELGKVAGYKVIR